MKRKTWLNATLAALSLVAVAGSALAQGAAGQGAGGQGGNRGNRGGRGGRGGGPASLLSIPEVQKELNMQQAQIDLVQGLRGSRGGQPGQTRESFRNMTPEERAKASAQRRADEEKKIAEILDAKQMARLKQLELQQEGPRALGREAVANSLNLTADQKAKVQATITAERDAMRTAFEGFRNNNAGGTQPTQEQRQAAFDKMRTMRAETSTKLTAILTDPQKKQFETMKGAAFTFPERQAGGRGRRGNRRPSTT